MNQRWNRRKTIRIGRVATTEPAMRISHTVRCFTTKRASPNGKVRNSGLLIMISGQKKSFQAY